MSAVYVALDDDVIDSVLYRIGSWCHRISTAYVAKADDVKKHSAVT